MDRPHRVDVIGGAHVAQLDERRDRRRGDNDCRYDRGDSVQVVERHAKMLQTRFGICLAGQSTDAVS